MKKRIFLASLLALSTATSAYAEGGVHFSYEGADGPAFWGALSSDYFACANGTQQSPVNLTREIEADLSDISTHWNEVDLEVINNGHTIQVQGENMGYTTIGDVDYELLQFHFHTPSEHAVDGYREPMEVHYVHKAEDGSLAVLGGFIKGGGENDLLDNIMARAPSQHGEAELGEMEISSLLPDDGNVLRYQGSLTTPPCSEIVLWNVYEEPIEVSDQAIAKFQAIFDFNARPLQDINRRYVLSE